MTASVPPPPGPRPLPIVGNLAGLAFGGGLPWFERMWRTHGDIFTVHFGPQRMHVVAHPEHVKHILVTHADKYVKGAMYDQIRRLTGDGMLTLDGSPWRRRRRLAQPSFHRKAIDTLVAAMVEVTQERLDDWRRRYPDGGRFDVYPEMMRLTLEVVGKTLFGQTLGDEADASGAAFGTALEHLGDRGNNVMHIPESIPTPANRRFKKAMTLLNDQTYGIIRRARAMSDDEAPTLLRMLIASRDADTGEPLTDAELRDECITLFLAGHETTALLLTWGFTLLTQSPAIEARMHDEIASVLAGTVPDASSVKELVYTRRVVDEILRLRSPVPSLGRDVAVDDVLGGHQLRAGDGVLPMTWLTHRHPDFWDDPDRFDPDRFLPERVKARHRWAYYPFSLGPRICIGAVFSLVEAQIVFAMLSQQCRITHVGDDPGMDAQVTLRPKKEVWVNLEWTG